MIVFKKVSCKNFFSVGNQPIVIHLNKSPTTLVAGTNGSGKSSTILDSIFFALFGKPFRKINKPQVVNSINNGDCVVELEFQVGPKEYRIVRGMRPNIFDIFENDKLIDQESATKDYQKYLEENVLGGLNEQVFKQVVVIGSADYRPFMQLSAANRREIIEELLDIKIFSVMLDLAKQKMMALKDDLRDLDYSIDLINDKIEIQKDNRKKLKEEAKSKKESLLAKIVDEQSQIDALQLSIDALQQKKTEYALKYEGHPLLIKSISDMEKLLAGLSSSHSSNEKLNEFFETNETCPTCKQGIDHDHKHNITTANNSKLKELSTAIDTVKAQLKKKESNIDTYKKIKQLHDKTEKEIYQAQSNITSHQRYITNLQKEITELSTSKTLDTSKTQLIGLETELVSLKDRRSVAIDDRQYYDVVASMLKDGGIKTKIIRQYIPIMNKIINDYLVRFGLPIEFTLDEQFNEVIKSRFRDGFQYNNFSEGEKQRIDTALLLAWRTIAKSKNTTNTNLLIMDETFDSSLDVAATEELLNILMEMDKNTNIFIISHKQDLSDKLRSQIEFEKVSNFTRIKVNA